MDITVPDGRTVHALVAGDPADPPLVYHVGSPHGVTPEAALVDAAVARGLSLVTLARPGYAGSTALPGRRVADAAGDTAAVLAALGHESFLTIGWSGGGPHALACAALLPGCRAAAVLGGAAPADAPDLEFLAGMGEDNVAEFGAAFDGPAALDQWLAPAARELATVTGDQVVATMSSLLPPADRKLLTGERGEELAASLREAVAGGPAGWRDDDLAFVAPWGIDLGVITVPVSVWQGGEDLMVPPAHGRWLAEAVPGARAHLLADEGHLFPYVRAAEVVDELLALAGD